MDYTIEPSNKRQFFDISDPTFGYEKLSNYKRITSHATLGDELNERICIIKAIINDLNFEILKNDWRKTLKELEELKQIYTYYCESSTC